MKMRWSGRAGGPVVAAAVVLSLVSAGSAVAGSLITSAQIKDNTIQSRDIHNGTIRGVDIKDGGVGYSDLAPAGRAQLTNDAAQAVSDWAEWAPTFSGATPGHVRSATVFPANTTIALDHAYLTGDLSACTSSYLVVLSLATVVGDPLILTGDMTPLAVWSGSTGGNWVDRPADSTQSFSYDLNTVLFVNVQCADSSGPVPVTVDIRAGFPLDHPIVWRQID